MGNRSEEREEFLADVMTTAVEGGIGYWSRVRGYKWDCPPAEATVEVQSIDDRKWAVVTIGTIAKGIGKVFRDEVKINPELRKRIIRASVQNDAGELDASDADAVLQVGIFGEVVYG